MEKEKFGFFDLTVHLPVSILYRFIYKPIWTMLQRVLWTSQALKLERSDQQISRLEIEQINEIVIAPPTWHDRLWKQYSLIDKQKKNTISKGNDK